MTTILGLVGGIGSGKSLVGQEFAKRGGHLISGDALGHEALTDENIKTKVVARWGKKILGENGQIQRRVLGLIVFADVKELRALEEMVFPFIGKRIREEIANAKGAAFIVVDAAVMMEAGWDENCDRIVFVDAPEPIRLRRLLEKRGWTHAEILARESAQLPLEAKRRRADYVIDNAASPEQIAPQVDGILKELNISS